MKKLTLLFLALACITLISCRLNSNGNVNINYKESDHYYSMNAHFSKNKNREVEKYMDNRIGTTSNISFINTQSDATFTLSDNTKFYMRKAPGHIEIKLNKDENTYKAYYRIKLMCEGIKKVIGQ